MSNITSKTSKYFTNILFFLSGLPCKLHGFRMQSSSKIELNWFGTDFVNCVVKSLLVSAGDFMQG